MDRGQEGPCCYNNETTNFVESENGRLKKFRCIHVLVTLNPEP